MAIEVGKKEPVTMAEAYEILEERKKKGEFGYEQNLAYEYVSKFKKLSAKEAKEMKTELIDAGLNEATATKIVDIMPVNVDQLKQVLIMEKRPIEDAQINEIMQIIEKHRKGKPL
ncbi:MAG: RNA polymerase Rpb4 family protein [Candidatus Micrarchaeia archaeon]